MRSWFVDRFIFTKDIICSQRDIKRMRARAHTHKRVRVHEYMQHHSPPLQCHFRDTVLSRAPWSADCILQDLIARLKACAKKRPAPKAVEEPAAKRGTMLVMDGHGMAQRNMETSWNIKTQQRLQLSWNVLVPWSLAVTSWLIQHHHTSSSRHLKAVNGAFHSHSSRQAKLRRVPRWFLVRGYRKNDNKHQVVPIDFPRNHKSM